MGSVRLLLLAALFATLSKATTYQKDGSNWTEDRLIPSSKGGRCTKIASFSNELAPALSERFRDLKALKPLENNVLWGLRSNAVGASIPKEGVKNRTPQNKKKTMGKPQDSSDLDGYSTKDKSKAPQSRQNTSTEHAPNSNSSIECKAGGLVQPPRPSRDSCPKTEQGTADLESTPPQQHSVDSASSKGERGGHTARAQSQPTLNRPVFGFGRSVPDFGSIEKPSFTFNKEASLSSQNVHSENAQGPIPRGIRDTRGLASAGYPKELLGPDYAFLEESSRAQRVFRQAGVRLVGLFEQFASIRDEFDKKVLEVQGAKPGAVSTVHSNAEVQGSEISSPRPDSSVIESLRQLLESASAVSTKMAKETRRFVGSRPNLQKDVLYRVCCEQSAALDARYSERLEKIFSLKRSMLASTGKHNDYRFLLDFQRDMGTCIQKSTRQYNGTTKMLGIFTKLFSEFDHEAVGKQCLQAKLSGATLFKELERLKMELKALSCETKTSGSKQ